MNRRGFTLIELMVVMAIVVVLLSIVMVALQKWRHAAKSEANRANKASIQSAVAAYRLHYGLWPIPEADQKGGVDVIYGGNNHIVVKNLVATGNDDEKTFLDVNSFETNAAGSLYNGWGDELYDIVFDCDYDGTTVNPNSTNDNNYVPIVYQE